MLTFRAHLSNEGTVCHVMHHHRGRRTHKLRRVVQRTLKLQCFSGLVYTDRAVQALCTVLGTVLAPFCSHAPDFLSTEMFFLDTAIYLILSTTTTTTTSNFLSIYISRQREADTYRYAHVAANAWSFWPFPLCAGSTGLLRFQAFAFCSPCAAAEL